MLGRKNILLPRQKETHFLESKIKKLSKKRKWYLDRRCYVYFQSRPKVSRKRLSGITRKPLHTGFWIAPKEFDLGGAAGRAELLHSLSRLRLELKATKSICLDFSNTEKLFADGTLLFLAEIRRMMKHLIPTPKITCIQPQNVKVSQVLQQIGFFSLIGAPDGITPIDDDVVNWRFAHGRQVEGEKYEDVLADFDGAIAEPLREDLFKGITEAMTNVVNHAYVLNRDDGLNITSSRQWWMFSQFKDATLTVVFLDLGAGIPRTLPLKKPNLWKKLVRFGRKFDSQAIDYAVKDSISRTLLENRGKGLGQIVRAVDLEPNGVMMIHSNNGVLVRKNGHTKRKDYSDSIFGTLIYWQIPLLKKEHL